MKTLRTVLLMLAVTGSAYAGKGAEALEPMMGQLASSKAAKEQALLARGCIRLINGMTNPASARARLLAMELQADAQRMIRDAWGVRLFDGSTFSGWEGATDSVFRVQDGAITGGSLAGNTRNEFLCTTGRYTNFILSLEYKLTGTEGFINGGVQIRSERIQQPPNEMKGYQADIGAGYSGALYDESRRNKVLARPAKELVQRVERPGDWNRYVVRCEGPRIRIWLNDALTADWTEADAAIPLHGVIGLQIHGNNKAEISFRDVVLIPMP